MIECFYGAQRSGKSYSAMEKALWHLARGGHVWFFIAGLDPEECVLYCWNRYHKAISFDQIHVIENPANWYKIVPMGVYDIKTDWCSNLVVLDEAEGFFNAAKRSSNLLEMILWLSQATKKGISLIFIAPSMKQIDIQILYQCHYVWCHKEWSSLVMPWGRVGRLGKGGFMRLMGDNTGTYLGHTEKKMKDPAVFRTYKSLVSISHSVESLEIKQPGVVESVGRPWWVKLAAVLVVCLFLGCGCYEKEKMELRSCVNEAKNELAKLRGGSLPGGFDRGRSNGGSTSGTNNVSVTKDEVPLKVIGYTADGAVVSSGRVVRVGDWIRGVCVKGIRPGFGLVAVDQAGNESVIHDNF